MCHPARLEHFQVSTTGAPIHARKTQKAPLSQLTVWEGVDERPLSWECCGTRRCVDSTWIVVVEPTNLGHPHKHHAHLHASRYTS